MATAYPLSWPQGFPRCKAPEQSRFKTSLPAALKNVEQSLGAFIRESGRPGGSIILSSNYSLGDQHPKDTGVAVWFDWEGEQRCIAVDRYRTIAENLQAIYHVLEARRTELRHGTLQLVRATFQGFKALPAPAGEHWSEILGVSKSAKPEEIEAAYREKAKAAHPDASTGSHDAMARLSRAKALALQERR